MNSLSSFFADRRRRPKSAGASEASSGTRAASRPTSRGSLSSTPRTSRAKQRKSPPVSSIAITVDAPLAWSGASWKMRQIEESKAQQARQVQKRRRSEAGLAQLLETAHADTVEALVAAEQRSAEARTLEEQLARVDERLFELGAGKESCSPWRKTSRRSTRSHSDPPRRAGRGARRNRRAAGPDRQEHRRHRARVKRLDPAASAADAAAEAEQALARVREIAARYVRIRVATMVLGREIERYRQTNQGPLLSRASELFHRLTLGSFDALKADWRIKTGPSSSACATARAFRFPA